MDWIQIIATDPYWFQGLWLGGIGYVLFFEWKFAIAWAGHEVNFGIYDDMFDETFDGIYNVVITFNHLSSPKTVEKTLEIKKVSKKGETDNQDAIVVTFTEG